MGERTRTRLSRSRRLTLGPLAAGALLLLTPIAVHAAAPIIDDFSTSATSVAPGGVVTVTVDAHDPDCLDTCTTGCGLYIRSDLTRWTATGGTFISENNGVSASPYSASAEWQAPDTEGTYTITIDLSDSGTFLCGGRQITGDNLDILVTLSTNEPPVIESLTAEPVQLFPGETSSLTCVATDPEGDPVDYTWNTDSGTVNPGPDGTAVFTADSPGVASVTCAASDPSGGFDSESVNLSVVGALPEKSIDSGLVTPHRLSIDSFGHVYVVDRSGGGLTVVNLFSGELVHRIPRGDTRSVAVDWKNDLLVGDSRGAEVINRRGATILSLASSHNLGDVSDVAVDAANRRYGVLHRSAGRIVVYDESGSQIAAFGSTGSGLDQFKSPQGLAVTPSGDWVVADSGSGQIKIFDLAGNLLSSFGDLGGGVGEFVQLDDVAVDSRGIIYTTDAFQDWVQSFNSDGSPRETLGDYGDELGQFRTSTGLVPAEEFDRLLVISSNSSKVQVFVTSGDPSPVRLLPAASLAPSSLTFGAQAAGTTSGSQSVVLANSGDAPLGVRDVVVKGDFVHTHDCGDFVDPGAACTFLVSFVPTRPGSPGGSMIVDSSDGPLAVGLFGTAFLPAGVRLSHTSLEFPDQIVETISEPESATLTNTGTVPLTVLGVQVSGEFLESDDCPSELPGGASCTFDVRFAPITIADHVLGAVTLTSSAAGSPHAMSLDGRGVPGVPSIVVADAVIQEGDDDAVEAAFQLALSSRSDRIVTVDFTTVSDTAVAGEDFVAVSGTLEFEVGETTNSISVPILGDLILEPDEETFFLELSDPVRATLDNTVVVGTILDNERCPSPNLIVNPGAEDRPDGSGIPGWTQAVGGDWQPRHENPDPHGGDAYFFAGVTDTAELIQDVDVSAFAASIDRGGQRFDFEGYVRSLDEPSPDTSRIVIEYRNADNTEILGAFDSGPVSSPFEWLRVADERPAPGETRWIRIRLISARLGGTENDGYFDSLALRSIRVATVSIDDPADYEGDFGESDIPFTMTMTCPFHDDVAVDYFTTDGTATIGMDYLGTTGTLVIPAGDMLGRVGVSLLPDVVDEPHETFFLNLRVNAPGDAVALDLRGVGTIVNDDFCPQSVSYWKSHMAIWPVDYLVAGGVEYDRMGLLDLLSYSGGNVPGRVARELVATKLNLAVGSDPSILTVVGEADDYLTGWPPGSDPTGADKKAGQSIQGRLKDYNEAHCGN